MEWREWGTNDRSESVCGVAGAGGGVGRRLVPGATKWSTGTRCRLLVRDLNKERYYTGKVKLNNIFRLGKIN